MKDFKPISSCFIVGVRDFRWTDDLDKFLKEYPVSGIALFNSPHQSPDNIWKDREASLEAVYEFVSKARSRVNFLAADQEGGRVRRLRGAFIPLPSAERIANTYRENPQNLDSIGELYRVAARQLSRSGVHLNFAPVCDLRSNESSGVIGDRSFGSTMDEVLPLIENFCSNFEDEGVHTTLKHFPGHGPTRFDSHEKIAVLYKPMEDFEREDFPVFVKAARRTSAVMTAHIAFEEEPDRIVSLDRTLLEKFRAKMPGELVWITDDLQEMKAVSERKPWIEAIDSNYDFLLLCGSLEAASNSIDETIRHLERKVHADFKEELALEKKIKHSQQLLRESFSLPSFANWKKGILDLETQGLAILGKLGLE